MNRNTQTLTVASTNPNVSSYGEELEEVSDYVNTAVCTVDKMSATSDKKCGSFTQCFLPVAVSWVILLVILVLHIYFTSVISGNINKLTAENQKLKTQNQELKTEKNKLTEQIRNIENNVTVTQQIIDAYCPIKDGNRQCKPCLDGWMHHQSSCYAINTPDTAGQKTWEEAQENCRGKNSDLAVIVNVDEKTFISDNSWESSGDKGYWIGLRAEDRKWKWIDRSDLAEK
ncbi:C-type lectin domain family 4 member G-like [Scomber scombrus]|uniref:C-type lectin domain family 4 member G-like n=1 Tax=Scomber scombrus TaxID=13677 RepID=UPI002DD83C69|nr:C-type lectin domain family 4 member G-like [Scomber scombrus]